MMKAKRLLARIAVPIVLLPVLALYGLRRAGEALTDFMDWAVEDRHWSGALVNLSDRIEKWSREQ